MRHILVFDFSDEAYTRLQEIRALARLDTNAAVVRQALLVLERDLLMDEFMVARQMAPSFDTTGVRDVEIVPPAERRNG